MLFFWYPKSFLASLVSILSCVIGGTGISMMLSGALGAGIPLTAIGGGGLWLASRINEKTQKRKAEKAAAKAGAQAGALPQPQAGAQFQVNPQYQPQAQTQFRAAPETPSYAPPAYSGGQQSVAARFCTNCGAPLAGRAFCAACGTPAEKDPRVVYPPSSSAPAPSGTGADPRLQQLFLDAAGCDSRGDFAGALRILQSGLQIAPDDPALLVKLGRAYRRTGQSQLALETYGRAAAVNPNDPTIYSNMGAVYLSGGLYADARPLYERAVRMVEAAPASVTANDRSVILANYAFCIGKLGDLAGAANYLAQAERSGYSRENVASIRQQLGLKR